MKPSFWDHEDVASGPYKHLFNFRRLWQRAVLITAIVALVPLIITALISYQLNMDTIESEFLLRTSRLVSNSWRSVSLFLSERRSALDFIAHDNTFEALNDPVRLTAILDNLNKRFGGFTDLGVLDNSGIQQTYVGPHHLGGLDYRKQAWFREALKRGVYISEVVLGFRNEPHIDVAVKRDLPDGLFFVLRAALETRKFNELIAQFEIGEQGDAFVINRKGVLQTPSRYCGEVLNKISLPIPEPSSDTKVFGCKDSKDNKFIIGHTQIPETPFILMIAMKKTAPMQPWYKTPWAFAGFLITSIIVILLVTVGVATHLVNQIHDADQVRVHTLHQVEYANKMASLGRLAAGVAHEINNPLAIINQKAGHIKDIFTLTKSYAKDPKLISLADSIISTVQRSGDVAKRLLNFAGHLNMSVQTIDLKEIINEIKGVLAHEAEYRRITVHTNVADNIPSFESDRGKLEQVFLNLFNYAFSSMNEGGQFEVVAEREGQDFISVTFTDNSRGIPGADLKRVFDPFFITNSGESGTGLGLAITYALVQEIGGSISVQSQLGKGTRFDIRLPLKMNKKRQSDA
jgi:signal transduction histidine kinase